MKYIIANWKSYKSSDEVNEWFDQFNKIIDSDNTFASLFHANQLTLILFVPSVYLFLANERVSLHNYIKIGLQNISQFDQGAYTGEISASMVHKYASYCLVGHSERRSLFNESEQEISMKISRLAEHNIKIVQCVRNDEDTIYDSTDIVAFEPVTAIGTGQNMPADEVIKLKKSLKLNDKPFLYGGSVKPHTASEYLSQNEIDGLLIGSASLDPQSFLDIAKLV